MIAAAYKTMEDPLWSVAAAVLAAVLLGLAGSRALFEYQKKRYEELAMAISDVVESPGRAFEFVLYSRRTL